MSNRSSEPALSDELERGFVAAVFPAETDTEDELAEFHELLHTAGVQVVGEIVQRRRAPDRRTYVGKGKFEELQQQVATTAAESLVVDGELDPGQQRRLEDALQLRVVDRTQVILDIFAQHAVTAEGKLQVELAQLEYNLPRMRGLWKHLERLGGGIGTRGPGESQLESDRRLARRRITLLRRRIAELERRRATQRRARTEAELPVIALAGYTNAGKSTLLNALTDATVSVNDRLFETLDPTTRSLEHRGRRYLVTDTVGFVRRLPHQLVQGFAATLEETLLADLILHVVDASESIERIQEQMAAVQAVLAEIGADSIPRLLVLNKVDMLDPRSRRGIEARFPEGVPISSLRGEGLETVRERIAETFATRFRPVELLIPHRDGKALSELYALGASIESRDDIAQGVRITARIPRRELSRFARYLVAGTDAEARR